MSSRFRIAFKPFSASAILPLPSGRQSPYCVDIRAGKLLSYTRHAKSERFAIGMKKKIARRLRKPEEITIRKKKLAKRKPVLKRMVGQRNVGENSHRGGELIEIAPFVGSSMLFIRVVTYSRLFSILLVSLSLPHPTDLRFSFSFHLRPRGRVHSRSYFRV